MRAEQIGMGLALAGLASILQPINLTLYSYGFYILLLGVATTFFGSIIPDKAKIGKTILQITSIFTIIIVILVLSIYLAPLLIM